MLLEIQERFNLLELLTVQEDSFANWKERRVIKETLSPNFEEVETIGLKEVESDRGKRLEWDTKKAAEIAKDLPISQWAHQTIRTKLAELNNKSELPERYMSIFEKFVLDYE